MDKDTFRQDVLAKYKEDPCGFLPNAFWKTADRLHNLKCIHNNARNNQELIVRDNQGLYLYWNKEQQASSFLKKIATEVKWMIIHADYRELFVWEQFINKEPFFRLIHNHQQISPPKLNEGYLFAQVNPFKEAEAISALICDCYDDLKPSPETVLSWTQSRVFDPSLWIWIVEKATKKPIALGIAEMDAEVPEGSLEWIQVLPKYHGKGLGKALVSELIIRLKAKAAFTTVSGRAENLTKPERLYRACGFEGDDIWWLLKK